MESRPILNRIPDTSMIIAGQGQKSEHMEAFRDADGNYAMVYLPVGKTVVIDVSKIKGKLTAWWFNPRNGSATEIKIVGKKQALTFTPPVLGKDNDWVLVIDNASKNYKNPAII